MYIACTAGKHTATHGVIARGILTWSGCNIDKSVEDSKLTQDDDNGTVKFKTHQQPTAKIVILSALARSAVHCLRAVIAYQAVVYQAVEYYCRFAKILPQVVHTAVYQLCLLFDQSWGLCGIHCTDRDRHI